MASGSAAAQLASQAAELAAEGQFAAAATLFQQAVRLDGGSPAVHDMLAQCLLEDGQDEAAAEAAGNALRLQPGWRPALLTLGRAARNAGRLRDAAAAFAACLEGTAPRHPTEQHLGAAARAQAGADVNLEAEEWEQGADGDAAELAAAAAAELAEVQQLLQLQLGHQLGLPGLRLLEQRGAAAGPSGCVWEAGALLAWFLVQQASAASGSGSSNGGGGCGCCRAGGTIASGASSGGSIPAAGELNGCGQLEAAACRATSCGSTVQQRRHPNASGSSTAGAADASGTVAAGGSSSRSALQGMRVLELGSGGTGIVGLVAACLGAHVTATDLPAVLPQLEASVALNAGMVAAASGSLRVAALDWVDPDPTLLPPLSLPVVAPAANEGSPASNSSSSEPGSIRGLEAPPAAKAVSVGPQPTPGFDWLLGADLVYSLAPVGALVAAIQRAAQHEQRAAAAAAQGSRSCNTTDGSSSTSGSHGSSSSGGSGGGPLKILLAHKHRHDDVDAALLRGLHAAGVTLTPLARDPGTRCTIYANAAARAAFAGMSSSAAARVAGVGAAHAGACGVLDAPLPNT